VTSLESAGSTVSPFKFAVIGRYWTVSVADEVLVQRIPYDATITNARIRIGAIDQGGTSSGTLEIDIQKKRGAGAWASIFSTRPSVAAAAGSYAVSTNQVISDTDLNAADLIRLDIKTQLTYVVEWEVIIEYTV
ncbi:MAG: hypothetical protein CUN55_19535, partial [Phototrophicales bacterium]